MVAIASTGGDLINMLKQAREFGMGSGKQKLASFVLTLPDIAALGLEVTQGVTVNEAFYWNLDAQTLSPSIDESALIGLKFSACLPVELGTQMLADRLADTVGARHVLKQDFATVVES